MKNKCHHIYGKEKAGSTVKGSAEKGGAFSDSDTEKDRNY